MIHTDALLRIAEQRGCDLRVAAHRHRLQRYANSFRVRRSLVDMARSVPVPSVRRRPVITVTSAATNTPDVCGCAA